MGTYKNALKATMAGLLSLPMLAGPAFSQGEDVTVLLTSEFKNMDPTETGGELPMVMYHIYCRLYSFDDDMKPVPDLVEQETVSDDNLTWTLKLRAGATFHDGTPVNAEAVKYMVDRMLATSGSGKILFQPISNVEILDDLTVKMTTEKPFPALRNNLAGPYSGLVSPAADKKLGDRYGLEPVSCGPYKFTSWTRGSELVLERFDDFYGPTPPYSSVSFQFVPDVSTRLFKMMNGEADVALRFGPVEAEQLRSRDVKVQEIHGRTIFYQLHVAKPPLDDVRVRKAINHAVDKNAIIKNVLAGGGTISKSVLAANSFGGTPVGEYEYDPEKARALLKDAGVESANLVLYSTQNRYLNDSLVAQAIAGYLRKVGLETEVRIIGDWASYVERVGKLDFDLYTLSWGSSTGDADRVLQANFKSTRAGKTWNFGGYKNEEIDRLIDEARAIIDNDERKAKYVVIQKKLFDDAPWLFLYRSVSYMPLSDKISTLHVLEGPGFPYLFDLPN